LKVIVLGAGVIGTCAAYYLNKAGHEVTVIERQGGAGLETSFANGGQISASHAAPWASPEVPFQMLKWLGRRDAPLLFHFRLDWRQWAWSFRFLINCLPSRARKNTVDNMRISLYSRELMPEIREDTGIDYDYRADGILEIYENQKDLDAGIHHSAWLRDLGCDNRVLSPDECIAVEPALAGSAENLVGGILTSEDESGDAHKFTHELATSAMARMFAPSKQTATRFALSAPISDLLKLTPLSFRLAATARFSCGPSVLICRYSQPRAIQSPCPLPAATAPPRSA
jgi:D-amino-acid dehydrogenase